MQYPHKIIVLDDDPTGTQTVRDVQVLTDWGPAVLESALLGDFPLFFILTNTRAFSAAEATRITLEVCTRIRTSSEKTGIPFTLVSRGDSTLRGHFPEEPEAIEKALGRPYDAWLIIPFFAEGFRFTKDDMHFVKDGDRWLPVGETAFARDPVLGFRHSNLKLWLEEKTGGRMRARDVLSLSLDDLENDTDAILLDKLLALKDRRLVIVNATDIGHLRRLVKITALAAAKGKYFLYRTAASWVKVLLEQATRRIRDDIVFDPTGQCAQRDRPRSGGLIVVGSFVPNTTAQVNYLFEKSHAIAKVEIDARAIVATDSPVDLLSGYAKKINVLLEENRNVLVYTSRENLRGETPEESQTLMLAISRAVSEIVRLIDRRPAWIIAKGGITSSTVATHSLGIRKALVAGSLIPGVPVWLAGDGSRYPGMIYVVFPGNIGAEDALFRAVDLLSHSS